MWAVYDLSAKWRAIIRRIQKRTEIYQQALSRCNFWIEEQQGQATARLEELSEAIQSCIAESADAKSMEVRFNCLPLYLCYKP